MPVLIQPPSMGDSDLPDPRTGDLIVIGADCFTI